MPNTDADRLKALLRRVERREADRTRRTLDRLHRLSGPSRDLDVDGREED